MTKEERMMHLFKIWADEYTDIKDFETDEDEFGNEFYINIQTEKLFNAFVGGWLECDEHRKTTKAIHDKKMCIDPWDDLDSYRPSA